MAMNMSLASSVSSTSNNNAPTNRSAMFMSPSSIGSSLMMGSPSPHHHHTNSNTKSNNNAGANTSSVGGGGGGLELDVHWDPNSIRSELQIATIILSQHCLKQAAKWAAEQLLGLPPPPNPNNDDNIMPTSPTTNNNKDRTDAATATTTSSNEQFLFLKSSQEISDPVILYAKSLLELGEYVHAASVLSLPNPIVTTMTSPLPNLSSYGIFLRAYALYLAGEKRKEEDYIELQR